MWLTPSEEGSVWASGGQIAHGRVGHVGSNPGPENWNSIHIPFLLLSDLFFPSFFFLEVLDRWKLRYSAPCLQGPQWEGSSELNRGKLMIFGFCRMEHS